MRCTSKNEINKRRKVVMQMRQDVFRVRLNIIDDCHYYLPTYLGT